MNKPLSTSAEMRSAVPLVESRLKSLLPERSDATYVGERMVRLSTQELEEVIETIAMLRREVGFLRDNPSGPTGYSPVSSDDFCGAINACPMDKAQGQF